MNASESYLMLATILFGFFTLYLYRNEIEIIEEKIYLKKENKKKVEAKRELEFDRKFPFLAKLNLNNKISENWKKKSHYSISFRLLIYPFIWIIRLPYISVKRIYRDGWGYVTLVILIFSLFFITRLYYNDFINGSDNYNVLGIKNMYENGLSFYRYSPITDILMLQTVKIMGFNLLSIKIPFIFYSFITLIFIYSTSRLLCKDLALLSSFLYVISPWATIQAKITRDYSFDLMIASIVLYLCLIIYNKVCIEKDIKNQIKYLVIFSLIPLSILCLYKFNRPQTLTVGIYTLITTIYLLENVLKKMVNNKPFFGYIYWISVSLSLLLLLFVIEKFPFQFGFHSPDITFYYIFFNPLIDSPWQWFHNINLGSSVIALLFVLGLFSFGSNNVTKKYILILFSSFFFGLFLYTFKYESHVNYTPVRYIYFLFIPYVIIISNAILNIFRVTNNKSGKIAIVILLMIMINPTAIMYSIKPSLAYEEEGISNVKIDNIGIGRFKTLEVADYLENTLNVNDETPIVFDGRYEEFILYLDRPMDKERYLLRKAYNLTYDVSKNSYIQSSYFGYTELEEAVVNNKQGIYVSSESKIYNEYGVPVKTLRDGDFYLYNTGFEFVENIYGFRIYSWKTNER